MEVLDLKDFTNKEYKEFIYNTILPEMNLKELTDDNIDDVYDYIVINYETAYAEDNDPRCEFINRLLLYMEQFMEFA